MNGIYRKESMMDSHEFQVPWKKGEVLLGRFRVEDYMFGGMGIVYKVSDLQGSGFMAVKTCRGELLWERDAIERFVEEARIWIRLGRHVNIVQAAFIEEVRGRMCIFMEFVEGAALSWLIDQRRLNLRLSLAFAIQFCRGMVYAQQTIPGIVHRDIKPANTLIAMNGLLKITDWGIAKTAHEASGKPFGTLAYMSPEQFCESSSVDTRSDVYSFGVMLYQILTSRLPFTPDGLPSVRAWQYLHSEAEPTPLLEYTSGVPSELEALTLACLEKRPENRPQSFENILMDLQVMYQGAYGEQIEIRETQVSEYESMCNEAVSRNALQQFEEAITACRKAVSLNADAPAAWINMGIALQNLGRYEEALSSLDRAIEIDPRERLAWNNHGNVLDTLERFDEAIVSFDQALELDPGYDRAWNNKGWALLSSGRYQEALKCFNEAIRIDPNYVDAWNNRGIALWKLGMIAEALDSCETALAIHPANWKTLANCGGLFSELGRYEDALLSCEKALIVNPRSYNALNNIGLALRQLGRSEEALTSFDKAIASPEADNTHEAFANKGQLLGEMNRTQEAIHCLREAVGQNPKNTRYLGLLGFLYQKIGDRQGARKSYQQAVSLGCPDPQTYYNYALLLDSLGEYDVAVERFREAIKRNPEFPEAYNNLGATLHKMGRFEDAVEAYNKCLKLRPDHALAYNNLGLSLVKLGRHSEAMAFHWKAVELKQDYSEGWRNLGMLQMRQKEIGDARTSFETAVKIDPADYRSWTNLSAIALLQDDSTTAAECARKALEAKPDYQIARNNLEIAAERLRESLGERKAGGNPMRSRGNDTGQLQKTSVDPRTVVSIKIAIAEGEQFPVVDFTRFAHVAYQALNPELYEAIEKLDRWGKIEIDCVICPVGHEHGMFGFAVALGQQEVKRGRSVLVQNDIEFAVFRESVKWPSRATFLTIMDYTGRNEDPFIGFAIGGSLVVEH